MTTTTKQRRLPAERPPREIRDNTKARRAWLEEKLAQINSEPNRLAKIVGKGSYQEISVYELYQVEGRLRHRGVCQFCGHSQVVEGGVLVLHGYKRPGIGYIFNRCPGVGLPPLNVDKTHTEKWLEEAKVALKTAIELEAITGKAASAALEEVNYSIEVPESYRARPRIRETYKTTEQDREAHKSALVEWAREYPLSAASDKAANEHEKAKASIWIASQGVQHFQYLIDSKVFGTKLKEEVVA